MDKVAFGLFVSNLRKDNSFTQKDLADRLMISDKAVSKWERGLSYPDITLLEPLSQILGVSIIELVQGRRSDMSSEIENTAMEQTVRDTLSAGTEQCKMLNRRLRRLRVLFVTIVTVLSIVECVLLFLIGVDMEKASMHLWTVEGLGLFFGIYFWGFMKEELPVYYDENKASCYTDGFFKISIPGIYFNNSNWPHIVNAGRVWSALVLVLYPLLTIVMDIMPVNGLMLLPFTLVAVFSLFIPIIHVGRKYQ